MTERFAILLLTFTAACTTDFSIGSSSDRLGVVEVYESAFEWTAPEACDIVVHRRSYDDPAQVISYDVTLGGRELSATYAIATQATHPLAIDLADHDGIIASLEASEDELVVRDAVGELAISVGGYASGPGVVNKHAPLALPGAAIMLLRCTLPMRTELGYVPGFVRNRRGSQNPNADGVVGSSTTGEPLLEWALSPLGAWVRQGMCLTTDDEGSATWRCGCFRVVDPIAGEVNGECGDG